MDRTPSDRMEAHTVPADIQYWSSMERQFEAVKKESKENSGALRRNNLLRDLLCPIWHTQLTTSTRETLFNVYGSARDDVRRLMQQHTTGPIPEGTFQVIPSTWSVIREIEKSQGGNHWSIRIPYTTFVEALKDVQQAAGRADSARKWRKEIESMFDHGAWRKLRPAAQLQGLLLIYDSVAKLEATQKEVDAEPEPRPGKKKKRPPLVHLYPNIGELASYLNWEREEPNFQGSQSTDHSIQAVPIDDWEHMRALLLGISDLFSHKQHQRRMKELEAILEPLWHVRQYHQARRAVYQRMKALFDNVNRARREYSDAHSGVGGWKSVAESFFDQVPTAWQLLTTIRNLEHDKRWVVTIPRIVLNATLETAMTTTWNTLSWKGWLATFKASQVYQEWNNIIPTAQLAILDSIYADVLRLEEDLIARGVRSELRDTWIYSYLLLSHYLKLAGFEDGSSRRHADPDDEEHSSIPHDGQNRWSPGRRSPGQSVNVFDPKSGEVGGSASRKRQASREASPGRNGSRHPDSSHRAHFDTLDPGLVDQVLSLRGYVPPRQHSSTPHPQQADDSHRHQSPSRPPQSPMRAFTTILDSP
ncbi:hypothetical protein JCM5353_002424 [Sporobolomyces roseus]